jgi:hypothetical protein
MFRIALTTIRVGLGIILGLLGILVILVAISGAFIEIGGILS